MKKVASTGSMDLMGTPKRLVSSKDSAKFSSTRLRDQLNDITTNDLVF